MTHKGAELMAWAQREAGKVYGGSMNALAVGLAEAYLRGAVDAIDEETEVKCAAFKRV